MTIDRTFLRRPGVDVAPDLLGCVLRHGDVAVRITEVEAYMGGDDPGSHAYRGRTARNEVMFGEPGHLYVYFTYGMHFCANVVCGSTGVATAVLLRAGEVVDGADVAGTRRPACTNPRDLARGPARLATALGLGRDQNGADLFGGPRLTLTAGHAPVAGISSGPRVGVRHPGGDGERFPWRFWIKDDPTVSQYRPHAPRRGRRPN